MEPAVRSGPYNWLEVDVLLAYFLPDANEELKEKAQTIVQKIIDGKIEVFISDVVLYRLIEGLEAWFAEHKDAPNPYGSSRAAIRWMLLPLLQCQNVKTINLITIKVEPPNATWMQILDYYMKYDVSLQTAMAVGYIQGFPNGLNGTVISFDVEYDSVEEVATFKPLMDEAGLIERARWSLRQHPTQTDDV